MMVPILKLGDLVLDDFADGATVEHDWETPPVVTMGEIPLKHDAFIDLAFALDGDDLDSVTSYGSMLVFCQIVTRGGEVLIGYFEVFSDCPGEV